MKNTMASKKPNKIREIVRLQQILKKWINLATSSKPTTTNKGIKFLKRTLSLSDTTSGSAVPMGYLAICVGEELKRFIIPTEYLGHPAFHLLLRQAEEEFGFQQTGVLRIPCEVALFGSILKLVEEKKDVYFMQSLGHCSSKTQQTPSTNTQSPMCI